MPITEGHDFSFPAGLEPGHEHDNDALALGAGVGGPWELEQSWHPREGQDEAEAWADYIPVKHARDPQDVAGGRQGVSITIPLFQPTVGASLEGSAVVQALPRDYARLEARVLAIGGPLLLAHSKEAAQNGYGQGAGASTVIPGPWAWIPSGVERLLKNCDEVWLALPGASATATFASIVASRRLEL